MKTPEKPVMNSFLWGEVATVNDDDECSISSTVSVENPPKVEPLSPSSSGISSLCGDDDRPRVRFDESSNLSYPNQLYAQEECAAYWYTGEDYQNFKAAVSFMAKMIDRAECISGLDYDRRDPMSYTGILEQTYQSCSQVAMTTAMGNWNAPPDSTPTVLSPTLEGNLKNLYKMEIGLCRLGLERRSVKSVSRDKSRRRADLLELLENSAAMASFSEEEVARQCESITMASRLFAHQLAQAQFLSTLLNGSQEAQSGCATDAKTCS